MLPQVRSFIASIVVTLIAAAGVLALAGAVRMAHTAGSNPRDALRVGTTIDARLDRNAFSDPERGRKSSERPLPPLPVSLLSIVPDLDEEPAVTDDEPAVEDEDMVPPAVAPMAQKDDALLDLAVTKIDRPATLDREALPATEVDAAVATTLDAAPDVTTSDATSPPAQIADLDTPVTASVSTEVRRAPAKPMAKPFIRKAQRKSRKRETKTQQRRVVAVTPRPLAVVYPAPSAPSPPSPPNDPLSALFGR